MVPISLANTHPILIGWILTNVLENDTTTLHIRITLLQLFDIQAVSLTPREKTLTLYSHSKKKTYGDITIQVQLVGIKVCV